MEVRQWCAVALATATIGGVLRRPFRLGEGIVALAGAALAVAGGLVSPGAALAALGRDLQVLAFFLGLMLLAYGAETAGLFRWLGDTVVAAAGGSPRRLMLGLFLAGTPVVALFSNDAAVLLLTPTVAAATSAGRQNPLPFVLACTFIADSASAVLPVSNPVNLLAVERLDLSPGAYLLRLTLPGLAAAGATALLFLWLFRTDLHAAAPIHVRPAAGDPAARPAAAAAFVVLGAAYLLVMWVDGPLGLVTLAVGVWLAVMVIRLARRPWWEPCRAVSWDALGLVAGLLLVVAALDHTGVTTLAAAHLARLDGMPPVAALLLAAVAVALAANLMNNWSAMLLAVSVLKPVSAGDGAAAAATGTVLGASIGAKLTTVGSLATVLWLALLRQRGLTVGTAQYVRTALVVTPGALAVAVAVAALTFR
jgi:arsenical pump membrane protein